MCAQRPEAQTCLGGERDFLVLIPLGLNPVKEMAQLLLLQQGCPSTHSSSSRLLGDLLTEGEASAEEEGGFDSCMALSRLGLGN